MNRIKSVVAVSALLFAVLLHAQLSTEEPVLPEPFNSPADFPALDLPLLDPIAVPQSGTFYFAYETQEQVGGYPPLPYNPLKDLQFKIYSLGTNLYLVDNRSFSLAQFMQVQAAMTESDGPPPLPGGGGTNSGGGDVTNYYSAPVYTTNDLWISALGVTNNTALLLICIPVDETNGVFDVLTTTNMAFTVPGLNATNWAWLLRTEAWQTNVTALALSPEQNFYRLGTLLDSDSDGLTDAFEQLISHTDPATAQTDSDGDGMLDALEAAYFRTLSQGAADDFDGDGVGNLAEMNASLNPSTPDSTGTGRIDQLFRVSILSPR